jgi:hypothetical protein
MDEMNDAEESERKEMQAEMAMLRCTNEYLEKENAVLKGKLEVLVRDYDELCKQYAGPTARHRQKRPRLPAPDDIPLRAKRPDKTTVTTTTTTSIQAAQQPLFPTSAGGEEGRALDRTFSRKDKEMDLPLPSIEDEKREFKRRFDRTVALCQATKPYVSEFGKGLFVPEKKFVEVVRKKNKRDALPGHACPECAKFYEAMIQQGIFTKETLPKVMKACSKHKAKYLPPDTPDGFWDLDITTPPEWKVENERKKKDRGLFLK